MIVQGNFAPLFRPGLRADFRDSYQEWETEYTDYLRSGTTNLPELRGIAIVGLNRLLERGDGEPITYEDPKLANINVGVDKEFAGGFMITRKTVEDDQYGKANQGAKWLAKAARLTYEYKGAGFLDDAFTGTFFKSGWDNLSIINTAHVPTGNTATTQANRPATDVQFSLTGLNALMDLWTVLKDENGDPIREWPDKLIIGTNPGDINTAMAITHSDKEPFTNANTDNTTKRRLSYGEPIVSHFKANAKSYFLVSSRLNDAHFLVRRAVEFDDTYDFDTDVAKYKCTTRFMIYVYDWRGWSGSSPT